MSVFHALNEYSFLFFVLQDVFALFLSRNWYKLGHRLGHEKDRFESLSGTPGTIAGKLENIGKNAGNMME